MLEEEMLEAAKNLEFEKAAEMRDRIKETQGDAGSQRLGRWRGQPCHCCEAEAGPADEHGQAWRTGDKSRKA